jgi:hypothetical protein
VPITLHGHGETSVLEHDPLDFTDEVLGHDRELPGIDPDLPVLVHDIRIPTPVEGRL